MTSRWLPDRLRRWSIAARLLALVAAIAVPLLVVNILQIRSRVEVAESLAQERIEARASGIARALDRYAVQMESAVGLVEAFAWPVLPDVREGDARLRTLHRSLPPHIHALAVIGTSGEPLASSSEDFRRERHFNYAGRDWFREAWGTREIVVSEPVRVRDDGAWVVVFARAIRDADGSVLGFAAATLDLVPAVEIIERAGTTAHTLVTVLSRRHRVVMRSVEADRHVGLDLSGNPNAIRVVGERFGRGVIRTADGIDRLSFYLPMQRLPWIVYIGTDVDQARAAPLRAGVLDLGVLFAITLLGSAGAIVIGRRVTVPLRALKHAAHQVADGNYTARVEPQEAGELGALQRDFNRMVARIEASEVRLRSLLTLSSDWYWEQDENLRFVGVSSERYLGWLGRHRWEDGNYGGITGEARAAFEAQLERHEPFRDFEFECRGPDGVLRWVSISGEPILDAEGRFRGYRGIGRDIDRRRRAEDAVRKSEARYRAVVESAGSMLWVADAEGRFVEPQPGLEQYTGIGFDRYQGYGWIDSLVHPDEHEWVRSEVATALAKGQRWRCGMRMWSAQHRTWRHTLAQGYAKRNAAGEVVEWIGSTTDIEEQRIAEAAYLTSEERLSAATHAAGIGVFDYNLRTQTCFFSPTWKELIGYADAELANDLGQMQERIHPDDAPTVIAQFEAFCAHGEGEYAAEYRFRHRDGSYRWMRMRARMFADRDGPAVRMVGAIVDMTENREREAQLAEQRRAYELALAAGRMVAWNWKPGENIRWGKGHEMIRGPLLPGMASYPDFRAMVHPDDRERYLEAGRRAYELREPYLCEFRLVWLDGSVHWINSQGIYECDARGAPVRLVGLAQDVTEKVIAGERLSESETRYLAVLETTTDTVVMIDEGSIIRYVNPAVETQFGWRPEELAGKPLELLQPQRLRAAHREGLRRALAPGAQPARRRAAEALGLHRDGHEFPIDLAFSGLTFGGQRYFVGFLRDITLRKQAEAEMREINTTLERRVAERTAELQIVNRELESFSYTVAHDLRAPLRAIEGFSQVLEEDLGAALDPRARRCLGRIRVNTGVMAQMIDELLEFSRIGRAEIALRPVDLAPIARQVVDELALGYPASHVEIRDLPEVQGDPTLLRVVLANLIGNALKFSAKRAVPQVTVSAVHTAAGSEIRVEDNGVGFDPQFADKLFGVFQRLHSSEEFEGTGIGLATVARIVARHGWEIRAESRPGEGATFRIVMPPPAVPPTGASSP
jgi:PAS domain S-box-containing protein